MKPTKLSVLLRLWPRAKNLWRALGYLLEYSWSVLILVMVLIDCIFQWGRQERGVPLAGPPKIVIVFVLARFKMALHVYSYTGLEHQQPNWGPCTLWWAWSVLTSLNLLVMRPPTPRGSSPMLPPSSLNCKQTSQHICGNKVGTFGWRITLLKSISLTCISFCYICGKI